MATPTQKFYALTDSLLSMVRVAFNLSRRANIKKVGTSDTISILANGPSLKQEIPAMIEGDKMAVNYFASTPVFADFRPEYYVFNAPEYWAADAHPTTKKLVAQLTKNLIEKVDWPMCLFVPMNAEQHFDFLAKENTHISIQKFHTTPVEGTIKLRHTLFNLQLGMPRPHNVLVPSIMMGIWMNYKTIKIYGADHSWLPMIYVDEYNNALLEQKHFYDQGETKPELMRKDAKFENGRKLHEMLEKFYLSFKAYHIIEAYSKRKNIKIYNATPGSFIDAFERKR